MSESQNSEWVDEAQPVISSEEPPYDPNHSSEASDGFMEAESSNVGIQNDVGGPENQVMK